MAIVSFRKENRFLSNFYPANVVYEGINYPSVEHAFQAAKTLDIEARMKIASIPSPGMAKRAGYMVQLRKDWENQKINIMGILVFRKFKDPILAQKLLNTGCKELIEGNTWGDKEWGCVFEDGQWIGNNYLGKILMLVREQLRKK